MLSRRHRRLRSYYWWTSGHSAHAQRVRGSTRALLIARYFVLVFFSRLHLSTHQCLDYRDKNIHANLETPASMALTIYSEAVYYTADSAFWCRQKMLFETRRIAKNKWNSMRGNAQSDGRPGGPIFRRLWTKLHRIMYACARVSLVCN